ncbi:hypothetical protein KR032_008021 [Drosophila birchii]|nr:hypothetical protein KR032_008021 [Drosophila birchii]
MDSTVDIKLNDEKVDEATVAETIEEPVVGTKKTSEEDTMPKNTTLGKKAQETKSDVGVVPITERSAVQKKMAKREEKLSNAFIVPKTGNANLSSPSDFPFSWKRPRDHFDNMAVPEKRKLDSEDGVKLEYVQGLVKKKAKLMPKSVLEPEFIETTRRDVKNMMRDQLEELVIQKMIEERKTQSELANLRTEMVKSENMLALYRRKIAEMSLQFRELEAMGRKNYTGPLYTSQAAGQNLAVTVKSEPHAAEGMLPSASEIPFKAKASNVPKPEDQAAKGLPKFRPRVFSIGPNPGGWVPSKEKPTKSSSDKIAKEKPAKATIKGISRPGQDGDNDVKEI